MNGTPPGDERATLHSLAPSQWALLWGILTLALVLRFAGIGWGLPPSTPTVAASGIRSSYAFDEVKALQAAARTDPARLDFDPQVYDWGTLHLQVVLFALEGAQALGVFDNPWRAAFKEMIPGDFERIYLVGRIVSVVIDIFTLFLTFLLGLELAGKSAAFWAAAFISVSPGHVLHAAQIRVDVTATALVVLSAVLALRSLRNPSPQGWILLGLAAGLAVAAKYSMVLIVLTIAATALWSVRFAWKAACGVAIGGTAGFLIGEPFVLTNTREVARQILHLISLSRQVPDLYLSPKPMLLLEHFEHLSRFSLGVPLALLAVWGFWRMARRRSPAGWLPALVLLAGFVSFLPQNFVFLRYQLPLLPFCAVAAAVACQSLPSLPRWLLASLALTFALAASLAQIRFMTTPHPANVALALVQNIVPKGQSVARVEPKVPPLDESIHPMGPNPFLDDLTAEPPRWVITTDLPIRRYPPANERLLATAYERVAVFRSRRWFPWATFGEAGAPHDWKYTHPALVLYRLR